ncbi:MAG: nucleotidyltransferase family protein [Nanoarchaeota archaeon]
MKINSIESIKKKIVPILKKNKVVRAGIFGSYARGEQKKNNDIDILIKTSKPLGFAFMKIQFEIEGKLKKRVDLLSYKALHPLLKEKILKEEIRII